MGYSTYKNLLLFFLNIMYRLFSKVLCVLPGNTGTRLLRSSSVQHLPLAWTQITHELQGSLNRHGEYWWHTAGYLLSVLLDEARYSDSAQRRILTFFGRTIVPNLGVAHEPGAQRWKSFMTDDHNPIELSWDWHAGNKAAPKIRFSIEPVGLHAGTELDPDNQSADEQFRDMLAQALPNTDMEWFNHFRRELVPESLRKDYEEDHSSKIFYAFDLDENEITSKAYFFPGLKARATSKTNLQVLAEAIRTAPHCDQNEKLHAFNLLEEFANDESTPPLEMDMLAIDMVNPSTSRLKIYFRNRTTTFTSVRQIMTMGNRINDYSLEIGLQNLRKLWDALLQQDGVPDDTPLPENSHRTAGILYNMEFRPGSKVPNIKIYIPVRHYARNDWQVVTALNEYIHGVDSGHCEKSDMPVYAKAMRTVFTQKALQEETGVHTYIGCSIRPGGDLRVVSYINPQAEKFA